MHLFHESGQGELDFSAPESEPSYLSKLDLEQQLHRDMGEQLYVCPNCGEVQASGQYCLDECRKQQHMMRLDNDTFNRFESKIRAKYRK